MEAIDLPRFPLPTDHNPTSSREYILGRIREHLEGIALSRFQLPTDHNPTAHSSIEY